jgi:hypothetical protein
MKALQLLALFFLFIIKQATGTDGEDQGAATLESLPEPLISEIASFLSPAEKWNFFHTSRSILHHAPDDYKKLSRLGFLDPDCLVGSLAAQSSRETLDHVFGFFSQIYTREQLQHFTKTPCKRLNGKTPFVLALDADNPIFFERALFFGAIDLEEMKALRPKLFSVTWFFYRYRYSKMIEFFRKSYIVCMAARYDHLPELEISIPDSDPNSGPSFFIDIGIDCSGLLIQKIYDGGNFETIRMLALSRKTDLDQEDFLKRTALSVAIERNDVGIVKALIQAGVDVNRVVDGLDTPLMQAVRKTTHSGIIKTLLEANANVNGRGSLGNTVLHMVFWWKTPDIAVFLAHGADVNAQNDEGDTPLHLAAFEGDVVSTGVLINVGAKVNIRNNRGRTPLHLTVGLDHKTATKILITAGADPTLRDDKGWTPAEVREHKGVETFVDILNELDTLFHL